jgi:hypothetical protein
MATSLGGARVPGWYWALATLALLWEALGCFAYLNQVGMDAAELAQLPAAQRDIWMAMPAGVVAAYAVAVWIGLTGAVGLLLRRRWARLAFAASLIAVIVQFGWIFAATPILSTIGPSAAAFPAVIVIVGAFLLWFSGFAAKRGWLR